jgi:hypothetical protein
MIKSSITIIAVVFASVLSCAPMSAQSASTTRATPEAIPPSMNPSTDTAADQTAIFGNYQDQAKRLNKEDKAKGKTLADLMAQDKADATTLVQSVQFTCNVTSAILAASGPATSGDTTINTKTYEVTCGDGMGYYLVSQEPGTPYGFTCFGAVATRDADVAAGRKPSSVCGLPANQDVKAMAAAVLSHAGKTCQVHDWRWIGQSVKSHTDYTEVACADGGYVIAAPLPGSTLKPIIVGCHESYLQGIPCKLSDNGPQIVTMQTFQDALLQHHVVCTVVKSRLVGMESIKQRHIVEFQCPEHPDGLVAYIPLGGNAAPFETVDCNTAAKRGITCKLTK